MKALFWFRRDLRLQDNAGLYHALRSGLPVQPMFIFDRQILDRLSNREDARVTFIYQQLQQIDQELQAHGSSLAVYFGDPEILWPKIIEEHTPKAVYTNHDYEPYARQRDEKVLALLQSKEIPLHTYKDQVIFERDEVCKDDGLPYTVFTPYSRKWRARLDLYPLTFFPSEKYLSALSPSKETRFRISLEEMGFSPTKLELPPRVIPLQVIKQYNIQRDLPAVRGTSRLGIHLRFGTLSVRRLLEQALPLNSVFVNELIWRDFYQMILWHYPHLTDSSFRPAYDRIPWENNEEQFAAWCAGETGYPLVDAGMRELNATGFMHNRVRMVTASFLTKHLLIDWRWGERYFAEHLLDFDLAANVGGWQWAAGCGTDAAPYFRVFNPALQAAKFDPDNAYIRKWIPEWGTSAYPEPIVVHEKARLRAIATYKKALG